MPEKITEKVTDRNLIIMSLPELLRGGGGVHCSCIGRSRSASVKEVDAWLLGEEESTPIIIITTARKLRFAGGGDLPEN